ncbi:MAG TPA: hybrid sensor histidine kinase/response regulator [Gemmataceae bacterium]|jgi:signal transduction histidine kinase/FixJ family two-component response regulator|nr:hybrid sensor histidine kinase/response regulator [Gemmataceae bacterium]
MTDDAEKANILIVDDLPEKVLVYRTILEELGQNLVVARSGEDALREILRGEFAVILLDVQMPGLNGFETAAMIRRRRRSAHTPIIFITAFADEVRQAEGYAQGAVDYILAPIVPEILRAKVRVFVDLFRMSQQVRRQAEERVALAEERARRESVEEANRRLTFLAGAAGALGQSLDVFETARDAARVAVPYLADAAAVVLIDSHEGPAGIALAEGDAANIRLRQLTSSDDLPPTLRQGIERALAERMPIAEPANLLAIPLRMRDRVLAVLALTREHPVREFGPVDRATAEALASRAAVALENARLYREVRKADQQKNDFLSMLAHELRNPLAPIRNAVEVMKMGNGLPEPCVWAGGVIDRQVRHLTRLVDDLLDVSRITRGKIELRTEPLDLRDIANQAVEAIRPVVEAKQHRLHVSLPTHSLRVHGDSVRLAQVLTNLLVNAAKYTDDSGEIWLTVSRDDSVAVVSIRDSGIGIPADKMQSIFELFAQVDDAIDRSQGGLGIGLTLAKRLVEMHGGTVSVASAGPGLGSEFVVRLPMRDEAETRPVPINGSTSHANIRSVARR